ncbi:hypothetical protein GCM10007147_11260 [Nocardiopsis kunsanensis]|uniref:Uncharacterized protein n=1 Tax=Nocardiopsis kunsanensis TaxID=141693 RepID=A0A919CGX2_9ACTN|nr:hypothetical protein GCM10007147_11260 [Nocardiopsis kunsanensis]
MAPEVPEGGAVLTRVKITVQVELIPGAEQASALSATLGAVNGAANRVSQVAFERGVPREHELRKHTYADPKARGLGAQAAQHVVRRSPSPSGSGPRLSIPTTSGACPGSWTRRPSRSGPRPAVSRTSASPVRPRHSKCSGSTGTGRVRPDRARGGVLLPPGHV